MKNSKKIFLILLSVFIIFAFSSSAMAAEVNSNETEDSSLSMAIDDATTYSQGNTYTVDGSASNQMTNPTIQEAIDNAEAGDTIYITGTEYEHCHFVIDKQLTIISTVGTSMTVCPSNTQGSGGIGIFYISPEASGTILSGFTLYNDLGSEINGVSPYGIYVDGASNVTITNCTIRGVTEGPGIYATDVNNLSILNSEIRSSVRGISIDNSENILIEGNTIESNRQAGVYFGENVYNTLVNYNTINSNRNYGIVYQSSTYANVTNNIITNNRNTATQNTATAGAGIYVNCDITQMRIIGNYISENGLYGVFNTYNVTNLVDQNVEIIDNNYFRNHATRAVFTQADASGATGIIYIWSNYFIMEALCPSTYYEPGVVAIADGGIRNLIIGNITQDRNGVYTISVVRADTGEVATNLNRVNATFFLNKNNNSPTPVDGDQAITVEIVNGQATVNFRNATYLESGNNITVVLPGYGTIGSSNRPSAFMEIPDENIPSPDDPEVDLGETEIIVEDLTKYYGTGDRLTFTLVDVNGNPIANQTVEIIINDQPYLRVTDENGVAGMNINLRPGVYNAVIRYNGTDVYNPITTSTTITVEKTISGEDITKIFRNGTQYYATFLNTDGTPLSNTNVTFNINGVMYHRTTNSNGTARLNINLNPGTYIITATNPVNGEEHSNTITVLPSLVESSDIVKYFRNGTQYTVKVLDEQGNIAVNETVTFNINGMIYERQTNAEGIATLSINLNPGTYVITATHNSLSVSNEITVLPTIQTNDLEMNFQDGSTFDVYVLDGQGNPAVNETVTFNINGVFYNRVTDDNGVARLNINLLAGEYIITSTYNHLSAANTIIIN